MLLHNNYLETQLLLFGRPYRQTHPVPPWSFLSQGRGPALKRGAVSDSVKNQSPQPGDALDKQIRPFLEGLPPVRNKRRRSGGFL